MIKYTKEVISLAEKKKAASNCESCENYYYDDEYCEYYCGMDLDEDEMMRFMVGDSGNCPYYRDNDEYRIVRKQN